MTIGGTLGNAPDVIADPLETKDYEITVGFKKRQQLSIKGTYDKNGLPSDLPELAEDILNFMLFYGIGENSRSIRIYESKAQDQ